MPFFKCDLGLVYFFHVPKCGGTSIEVELINKGFKLSFYDPGFSSEVNKFCKSSPQHITQKDFKNLFAEDMFFYKFALVRDPVTRLLSAYAFNRDKIGGFVSFEALVSKLEKNINKENDYFGAKYDNHFVPANRFISEDSDIFYLEKDMRILELKLHEKLNVELDLSKQHNKARYKVRKIRKPKDIVDKFLLPHSPKINELSEEMIERIKLLYSEDYQRFNFER